MHPRRDLSRRELMARASTLALASWLPGSAAAGQARPAGRGRLRQSVCRWCYAAIPLPDFCRGVSKLGLTAIDLLTADEWPVAREFGLTCSMGSGMGGPIERGLNDPANHESIVNGLRAGIPLAAKAGVPNVITFFGNRRGRGDAEAIAHCVTALNRVKGVAEDNGVTICVELLNSRVNHKDYQGDRTSFGVAVVSEVNSPRVKLLYDIYHMQTMEGDVIRTIRDNQQWIGHYHTGGVPRPQRDRRLAGAVLPRDRACDRRHGIHRVLRARVHPEAGPVDLAWRSGGVVRGLNDPPLA